MKKKLTVVMVPATSRRNPYLYLLIRHLEEQGTAVIEGGKSRFFPILIQVIRNWKPGVVHLHWQHPFLIAGTRFRTVIKSMMFLGELTILKILGIRLVWTVHNLTSHEGIFAAVELFFCRRLAGIFHALIVHSRSARRQVMEKYGVSRGEKIHCIPHARMTDYYPCRISRSPARRKLKIPPTDLVFLSFGLIRGYKNLAFLIQMFRENPLPGVRLLIVGPPFKMDWQRDLAGQIRNPERIRIIAGFVPEEEVQVYMRAADVVLLAHRDSLTSALIPLAMSFGKPVMAPATAMMQELLPGEANFFYQPKVAGDFLRVLQKIPRDPKEQQARGEINRKRIMGIRWQDTARLTRQVYRGAPGGKCR